MKPLTPLALLVLSFIAGSGCSSTTQLNTTWKDPSLSALSLQRVVVLVLNTTPGERRAQEDALVSQIKRTSAVPAYTILPDADLRDQNKIRQAITQAGFDGAIVLRLIDSREETAYAPGPVTFWGDSGSLVPYHYSQGYTITNTIVRAEVNLYSVPEGKLLWTASSATANPTSAHDFAVEIARAAADELRNQGLIP